MHSIFYRTDGRGPFAITISDRLDITRPCEQGDIIEACAADFHGNRDGFEAKWPLEFTLHESKDGPAIASMHVDLEYEPTFTAYTATQPQQEGQA